MNAVSKSQLWGCDLPPLADLGGETPLTPGRVTDRLKPALDQALAALDQKKRIIVIQAAGSLPPHENNFAAGNADVYQFALRGLAADTRFQEYEVISPDDRVPATENKGRFATFIELVIRAEEEGWSEEAIKKELLGGKEKAIFVVTPELLALLPEGLRRAASKFARLFDIADQTTITLPQATPQDNLYNGWDRYMVGASTDTFREAMIAALQSPVAIPHTLGSASKRGPRNFLSQGEQKRSETELLQALQGLMYAPGSLWVTGVPGVGKSTWTRGLLQVAVQAGLVTPEGVVYQTGPKFLETPPANLTFEPASFNIFSTDRRERTRGTPIPVNMANFGGWTMVDEASRTPQLVEGSRVLRPTWGARVIMTSNSELRGWQGDALHKTTIAPSINSEALYTGSVPTPGSYGKRTNTDAPRQVTLKGEDWATVVSRVQ